MKKTMISIFSLLILLATPFVSFGEQLQLSMLPRYAPEDINKRIIPLAQYISQEIGQPVTPVLTRDFGQYENKLKTGEIQIGYENPYIYTLVSETHEVLAMAIKGGDGDKFRGIIITRADSDIVSLDSLRNRKIMVVGRTSAGGYLSQKLTLAEAGINVEKDCQIAEAVDNKQENVVLAVYMGEAAAGFIRESALNKVSKFVPMDQIKVINRSAWLPNWALSVKRSLPANLKKSIQKSLVNLNRNDKVIKTLRIDGFRIATDQEYDPVRKAADLPIPKR